jgi:hypothetical protein
MMGYGLKFVSTSLVLMESDFPILSGRLQAVKRRYFVLHANHSVSITSMSFRRGAVIHRAAD